LPDWLAEVGAGNIPLSRRKDAMRVAGEILANIEKAKAPTDPN
jgi:hypothetical protein